jgi:hypothetical protein
MRRLSKFTLSYLMKTFCIWRRCTSLNQSGTEQYEKRCVGIEYRGKLFNSEFEV